MAIVSRRGSASPGPVASFPPSLGPGHALSATSRGPFFVCAWLCSHPLPSIPACPSAHFACFCRARCLGQPPVAMKPPAHRAGRAGTNVPGAHKGPCGPPGAPRCFLVLKPSCARQLETDFFSLKDPPSAHAPCVGAEVLIQYHRVKRKATGWEWELGREH